MKKFLLSFAVIVIFTFYAINNRVAATLDAPPAVVDNRLPLSNANPIPSTQVVVPSGGPKTPPVAVGQRPSRSGNKTVSALPVTTPVPAPSPVPMPVATPAPAPAPNPVSQGQYRDGVYTGDVADAYYGNVQVQAVIQNGRLSDVQVLDYPHDRNNSIRINSRAMPMLVSEAIQAQNAQIDVVSGATASSGAFQQSLASALSQARS